MKNRVASVSKHSDDELAPVVYRRSIAHLRDAVEKSSIEGVFADDAEIWGSGATYDKKRGVDWTHFRLVSLQIFRHLLKTPGQAMAEKLEEFGMLQRGLHEFSRETVAKAMQILQTEQLYRGEKTAGVATWLLDLHNRLAGTQHRLRRDAIVWQGVATAPVGYCHIKATMIGTLLEDLASGMAFDDVARRFAAKMHPLQYQRAQVMPTEANIAEAEKIVEKMGVAPALKRRFARLEDLQPLWMPHANAEPAPSGGVFAHLKPHRGLDAVDVGAGVPITWEKFARVVLPSTEKIEMLVPFRGNFLAFITASDPDAPPILQWDSEEMRNPLSWYVYSGGSFASSWGLMANAWQEVTAATLLPPMWSARPQSNHGEGVVLILKGARDLNHQQGGGFFTESLKSEYHSIRRTIEAFVAGAAIAGKQEASACGYDLRKLHAGGGTWGVHVRVTANGMRTRYLLDRWD